MSKSAEFRQYAEEAMRWARQSKNENEKEVLIDIARTWTQAASYRESAVVTNHGPLQKPGRG
jgi:hypothetical protein